MGCHALPVNPGPHNRAGWLYGRTGNEQLPALRGKSIIRYFSQSQYGNHVILLPQIDLDAGELQKVADGVYRWGPICLHISRIVGGQRYSSSGYLMDRLLFITLLGWIYTLGISLVDAAILNSRLDANYEEKSEVVYPKILQRSNDELLILIKSKKETFYIQLFPNRDMLTTTTVEVAHSVDQVQTLDDFPTNCHFHGKLLSHSGGVAAISNCHTDGKLSGLITTVQGEYILEPHHMVRRSLITNSTEVPHILYRRGEDVQEFCGVDSNSISVETKASVKEKRVRRSDSKSRKIIQTAIFTDSHLYNMFSKRSSNDPVKALTNMVLTLMNQVQLIYNYNSMKTKFKIVIVKLVILKPQMPAPDPAGGDIDLYLDNFCAWQASRNPLSTSVEHWDHGLMLTGLDLYKKIRDRKNDKVLGLAWVNGMCRPHFSCTLNEGASFEATFVIAHELGHSLGMLHDGRGNRCDPDTYIMSEKTGPGKVTWSTCSNEYVEKFFSLGSGRCLTNEVKSQPSPLDHEKDDRLPGQRYPPEEQCKMALGGNHKPYQTSKEPFNNICRELWCLSGMWASPAHPALDGSKCEDNKICLQGECVVQGNGDQQDEVYRGLPADKSSLERVKTLVEELLNKLRSAFKVLG